MNISKNTVCKNCTLKLVTIAYKRAPWIRLLREPLKLGMRSLAFIHHINCKDDKAATLACYDCIRFYKVVLREKSATFRWLHTWINPIFDYYVEKIVTNEERKRARAYARAASEGSLSATEVEDWMQGLKTGF